MAKGRKTPKPGANPKHYRCGERIGDWVVSMQKGSTTKMWRYQPA